jgi:predicted RNA binding protein YcfA (HicA-like mRNA interferase family)
MPKLPVLSGDALIRALQRLDFEQTGQRGSHVKLRRDQAICIVPLHRELKRGTLAGILRQADVSADDLLDVIEH